MSPVFKKEDKTVVERRKSCQDKQGFAGVLLMVYLKSLTEVRNSRVMKSSYAKRRHTSSY